MTDPTAPPEGPPPEDLAGAQHPVDLLRDLWRAWGYELDDASCAAARRQLDGPAGPAGPEGTP